MKQNYLFLLLLSLLCTTSVLAQSDGTKRKVTPTEAGTLSQQISESATLRSTGRYQLKTTEYVASDITGQKVDVGAALKAGKKVFIDISTIWCHYCWDLHLSGHLDDLYHRYGPGGSNEFLVLWLEDEGASVDKIRGQKPSMGDWTHGGDFPIPIISDNTMSKTLGISTKGYPTNVVLFPDGSYDYFNEEIRFGGAKVLYERIRSLEQPVEAVPIVHALKLPVAVAQREYRIGRSDAVIFSRSDISTLQWTFGGNASLATYEGMDTTLYWQTPGQYPITLTATNRNGASQTFTTTIEVHPHPKALAVPYEESFEQRSLPAGWFTIDQDGDGTAWESINGFFSALKGSKDNLNGASPLRGQDALVAWSFKPYTYNETTQRWNCKKIKAEDYLFAPKLSIPQDAPQPVAYFHIRSTDAQHLDACAVLVSTKGQVISTLTDVVRPLQSISADWTKVILDLSSYRGQDLFIAIRHQADGASGLVLDDYGVSMDGYTDILTPSIEEVSISLLGRAITIQGGESLEEAVLYTPTGVAITSTPGGNNLTTLEIPQEVPYGILLLHYKSGALSYRKVLPTTTFAN